MPWVRTVRPGGEGGCRSGRVTGVPLAGSYELLMIVIRCSQAAPDSASGSPGIPDRFRRRQPWDSPMSWQRICSFSP